MTTQDVGAVYIQLLVSAISGNLSAFFSISESFMGTTIKSLSQSSCVSQIIQSDRFSLNGSRFRHVRPTSDHKNLWISLPVLTAILTILHTTAHYKVVSITFYFM